MISIIIPTYNSSNTLQRCLLSIFLQKFDDYEVIIIDNRSIDGIEEILNQFNQYKSFIRFVSEKDNGIYDAMNKGINLTKGEWIYFLGSDDRLINNDVLLKVSENLKASNDIVYGDIILEPGHNIEVGEWNHQRLLNMCINHQRIFYKATLFKTHGKFETKYRVAADYDLNIRFFCNKVITKQYINLPIAIYNSEGFSSRKMDEIFWDNFKKVMVERFSPYLSKKEIYGRLGFYCWYNMQQKKYGKALRLSGDIFFYTHSIDFVKHSFSQLIKSLKN